MSKQSTVARFLAVSHPAFLVEAVINVRERFEAEQPLGLSHGSDLWLYHPPYQQYLIDSITNAWCDLTGYSTHEMPYSQVPVLRLWESVRKIQYGYDRLREDLKKVRYEAGGLFTESIA